jgi:predicted TIM-barrel fold metal-dependent hydrolase
MALSIEDSSFFTGHSESVTFLPEPGRRTREHTIISVDDHIVEPPNVWQGRMPAAMVEAAPRIVEGTDGGQVWNYDGKVIPNIGLNAVVGRPIDEYTADPIRFEHMRRGAWDIHARIADMDLDGTYASLNFPSHLPGFGGGRLQTITGDRALALASVRAWNDWHIEEWAGPYPERIIPCQITWLHDPLIAAEEIRKNSVRGFRALSFPESPDKLGLPSIHDRYWDPLFAACEETETVVCLHVGSGGTLPSVSTETPMSAVTVLFGACAMYTAIDWLFSGVPLRFPTLKVCLSEGGIGWVPGILDRLDHCSKYDRSWPSNQSSPSEVFQRNFWFCSVDDPSTLPLRHRIGLDRILIEVDYPHADSSWPDSQPMFSRYLKGVPADEAARITWKNASDLFRHPVPDLVVSNPNAF